MWHAPNFEAGLAAAPTGLDEHRAELRLWGAVFVQALQDWRDEQRGSLDYKKSSITPGEPTRWVRRNASDVGTFVWLCELFSLDPSAARTKLARLDCCVGSNTLLPETALDNSVAIPIIRTVAGQSDNQPGARK